MGGFHAGVDIGGTKTVIGIFDDMFRLIKSETFATSSQKGCRWLVNRIGETYGKLLAELDIKPEQILSVGVASPGPLGFGKQQDCTYSYHPGRPRLSNILKVFSTPVALKTKILRLLESVFGQGRGLSLSFTNNQHGIGCGLVCIMKSGRLFFSRRAGTPVVVRDGLPCPCGSNGRLEAYSSGTAIARIASRMVGWN